MKRQTYEQSVKEYEGYLEEERRLWEKKKQFKWQIKNDLMDQIKSREDIIVRTYKLYSRWLNIILYLNRVLYNYGTSKFAEESYTLVIRYDNKRKFKLVFQR